MFEDKELDEIMAKSEEEKPLSKKLNNAETSIMEVEEETTAEEIAESESENLETATESSKDIISVDKESSQLAETSIYGQDGDFKGAVNDTRKEIIDEAKKKINDKKMIKKHSNKLKKITDKALGVEAEQQEIVVEDVEADNKVKRQEIKNRLIVLRAEATRTKREEKQKNKEQKSEYIKRNKEAKWELYKDKLTRMKYNYVPNAFILGMLLFFDGVAGFFKGVGEVSTAMLKALKWFLFVALVIIVLMIIPVTREWLLSFLQFI